MGNKVTQKIMESFKGMIPEDQASNVEQAISEFVEETESKIKSEYEQTLEESYKEWDEQLREARQEGENKVKETEAVALEGYQEAKSMLETKEEEIIIQKSEFENFLEEQYAIAGNMLEEEKNKNEEIEQNLYEAYSQQIEDIKEDLVNKIDNFLNDKVEEISVAVRKELKNSPEVLENKVAFDRIKDIVTSSLTVNELQNTSSNKVDELEEGIEDLQKEIKALKAKNLRLTTENAQYNKEAKTISESYHVYNESYNKGDMVTTDIPSKSLNKLKSLLNDRNIPFEIINLKGHGNQVLVSKRYAKQFAKLASDIVNDDKYDIGTFQGEFLVSVYDDNLDAFVDFNTTTEYIPTITDLNSGKKPTNVISLKSESYYEAVRREAERRISEKNAMKAEGRGNINELSEKDIIKENAADIDEEKNNNKSFGGYDTKDDLLRMAGIAKNQ